MARRLKSWLRRHLIYAASLLNLSPLLAQTPTVFSGAVKHGNNPVPNMVVSVNSLSDTTGLDGKFSIYDISTDIKELANAAVPDDFRITNFPNPFNPNTTIRASVPGSAKASVYNVLGQEIASADLNSGSGEYQLNFIPGNIAAGVYFIAINGNGFNQTRKMTKLEGGSGSTQLDVKNHKPGHVLLRKESALNQAELNVAPVSGSAQALMYPGMIRTVTFTPGTNVNENFDVSNGFTGSLKDFHVYLVDSTRLFNTGRPEHLENLIARIEVGPGFSVGKVEAKDIVFINAGDDTSYKAFNAPVPNTDTFVMKRGVARVPVPNNAVFGSATITDSLGHWNNFTGSANEDMFVYMLARENPNSTDWSAYDVFRRLNGRQLDISSNPGNTNVQRMAWKWEVKHMGIPVDTSYQCLPYRVFRNDIEDPANPPRQGTETRLPHDIAVWTKEATDEITQMTGIPTFDVSANDVISGRQRNNIVISYYNIGSHLGETLLNGLAKFFYQGRELFSFMGANVRLD